MGIFGLVFRNSKKGQPKKTCIKLYLITAHLQNSGPSLASVSATSGPAESIAMVNCKNFTNLTIRAVNTHEGHCQKERLREEKCSLARVEEPEVFHGEQLHGQGTETAKANRDTVK